MYVEYSLETATRGSFAARCFVGLAALALCLPAAAHLQQTNPVKKAPSSINDELHANEYPWFSGDGRLLIWTKQCKYEGQGQCDGVAHPHARPIRTNSQWLWVARIDEGTASGLRKAVPGEALPTLSFDGQPTGLEEINHFFIDEANRQNKDLTIKSFAVCEESPQPQSLEGRDRYLLTLFMAVGEAPPVGQSDDAPGLPREIWRAYRLVILVRDNGTIDASINPSRIVKVPGTDAPGKNETEPMLTSDGHYLFWGSNAFNGGIAEYLYSSSPCGHLTGNPLPYSDLPSSFAWKDQYTEAVPAFATSNTNYHTLLERSDGQTALIFENGHGKVACLEGRPYVGDADEPCAGSNSQNQDCLFKCRHNDFWTTGFDRFQQPEVIQSWSNGPLNLPHIRVSHPAIAGPQNSAQKSWVLFFMRGKKIWYTKIAEP